MIENFVCEKHPDRPATKQCLFCQKMLCDDCASTEDEHPACFECAPTPAMKKKEIIRTIRGMIITVLVSIFFCGIWFYFSLTNEANFMQSLLVRNEFEVNAGLFLKPELANSEGFEWTALLIALRQERPELAKKMIEHGADVNATKWKKWAPVHEAISRKNYEMTKYLLEKGADPSKYNSKSLFVALDRKDNKILKLLLEHKTKPDVTRDHNFTSDDLTPLRLAIFLENNEAVKLLLEAGADPDFRPKDKTNYSPQEYETPPLFLATRMGNTEVVKLLLEYSAETNVAFKISEKKLKKTIAEIQSTERKFDIPDILPYRAMVSKFKLPDRLEAVLWNNRSKIGKAMATPLHWAVHMGHLEITKLLIKHGANIEARDKYNAYVGIANNEYSASKEGLLFTYTPLDWAVQGNQAECVKFLLSKGAKIKKLKSIVVTDDKVFNERYAKNKKLINIPLEIAQKMGTLEIVKLLEEHLKKTK